MSVVGRHARFHVHCQRVWRSCVLALDRVTAGAVVPFTAASIWLSHACTTCRQALYGDAAPTSRQLAMLNGEGSEADYDTDGLPADRRMLSSAKKPRYAASSQLEKV